MSFRFKTIEALPEIAIKIISTPVKAKARKLKAKWYNKKAIQNEHIMRNIEPVRRWETDKDVIQICYMAGMGGMAGLCFPGNVFGAADDSAKRAPILR